MSWRSVLVGLALACACNASAADTREVTEVSLSNVRIAQAATDTPVPLRPSEGLPRYSVMNPPPREEVPAAPLPREDVPAAAPTEKVKIAPAAPVSPAPVPADAPRYSAGVAPPAEKVASVRPSEDAQYRLGTGDKLRLTVFNEPDLSGEFAIDGQGFVRLPLLGQVVAAGLTSYGLEERLAAAFVGGGFLLNPRISVEIVTYRPFYIIGEVAKPGEYAYVNAMAVPNAIALAGGFTDRAVTSTILIRRLGDKKERELRADETTRIYPGDVVRVERSAYWSVMTLLAPLISPFATTAYILK